jgi:hypothetical protein
MFFFFFFFCFVHFLFGESPPNSLLVSPSHTHTPTHPLQGDVAVIAFTFGTVAVGAALHPLLQVW